MTAPAQVRPTIEHNAYVYCPICTHTVEAEIQSHERRVFVRPGQKCPRCATLSLCDNDMRSFSESQGI